MSIIISIITKRLKPVLDICPTTMNSTGMKRSNTSKLSSTIHRTHSFPRRSKTLPSPDTPSDVNTLKYKQVLDDKVYLSLLKALTVILYLLQNGSVQFIDWLLKDYKLIISPYCAFRILPHTRNRYGIKLTKSYLYWKHQKI